MPTCLYTILIKLGSQHKFIPSNIEKKISKINNAAQSNSQCLKGRLATKHMTSTFAVFRMFRIILFFFQFLVRFSFIKEI